MGFLLKNSVKKSFTALTKKLQRALEEVAKIERGEKRETRARDFLNER